MRFRLHHVIHFAVLALATSAAPVARSGNHSLDTHTELPRTARSLLPLIDGFDMQKTFALEDPPGEGTRVVPPAAMAAVPTALDFVLGKFNPDAIIKATEDRFLVDTTTYDRIETVLKATTYTVDLIESTISGEQGLTHVLYQQLGGPLNALVSAIGKGDWTARGKGDAPIEDWRYIVDGGKRAVLELKTSHALTSAYVDKITTLVREKKLMMKERREKDVMVNSLVDTTMVKQFARSSRQTPVLALEQVLAEMYNSHSYIGVLTNGHDWIVCQRVTDASGKSTVAKVPRAPTRTAAAKETIAVTKLTGVRPNGKSHALNILLAITLWADQHTTADATS